MAKQLKVSEVKRFSSVGETITMGNHENTSIRKEFTYKKISEEKKFNSYFVQNLKQHTRV